MARKRSAKGAAKGERTEEYKAFENLARTVLSVPKTELDKREAEGKRQKSGSN